jgi:hypothetical protein
VSATFYSDAGQPLGALTWAEGRPARYDPIVPDLDPVDVSAWVPVAAHGLALAAPGEGTAWSVGGGALSVDRYAPGDVTADAYRDALAAGCACRVVDRHSAWLDGRAGVRFLVELPGPDGGRRGEAWAFPVDDAVVALAATWPVDDPGAHAALRAMVALATWEASP